MGDAHWGFYSYNCQSLDEQNALIHWFYINIMSKIKGAFIINHTADSTKADMLEYVYGKERVEVIRSLCDLHPQRITTENLEQELPALKEVEVIFSCWGMIPLTSQQLDKMPKLKVVFYASGTVQAFAKPFVDRGIILCSATAANAIPVAEFCLAQIILSCKGAYRNSLFCKQGPWQPDDAPKGKGVYGETIALLGIGAVSRHLLQLLKPFNLRVIALHDYLSLEQSRVLGIDELVDLETAFREAYVVSNHLPDKPATAGLITESHFRSMRKGATFINTGRGAQVNETGLVSALHARPDLTALLDVQYPEPPEAFSPLYGLPNIQLTSHIAGSTNDEVRRMADCMIDEFKRWQAYEPLLHQVDPSSLAYRA